MRLTTLRRSWAAVAATLLFIVLSFAYLRVSIFQSAQAEEHTHTHGGGALFQSKGCSQCHFTDSRDTKIGPGLKGLFARETLPASGRAATEENVRTQLKTPYKNMPSYADRLTGAQRDLLIQYLKSL